MAQILFNLMFKVFFVVAAAYVLRRRGVLTAQDQKSATNILMKLVVYFTVIMSSQSRSFPWRRPGPLPSPGSLGCCIFC